MGDRQMEFRAGDYAVCGGTLAICFAIGVYFTFRGNRTTEDYLLGGRTMSPLAVTLSLLTTFISAYSFLGTAAETYGHGLQITADSLGGCLGIFLASKLMLPVLYPLKLVSTYEYIERRFRCPLLTHLLIALYLMMVTTVLGVLLYTTAMALGTTTPLPTSSSIFVCGVVCTFYSSLGGLKAVVWTDVIQTLIMVVGLLTVIAVGITEAGGIVRMWDLAAQGGRTQYNFSPSLHERHTFWGTALMGTFAWMSLCGASQANHQRTCSVDSLSKAQRMLYFTAVGQVILQTVLATAGLCAYVTYFDCDPVATGILRSVDEIMPYFVMDKMGHFYVFPGLFVAAVFCSSLSTMSSYMNSMTAVIWEVLSHLRFFKKVSELQATTFQKIISLCFGASMMGIAILASELGGILQMGLTIAGVIVGTKLGVYLLGLLVPWCSKRGALLGFFSAVVFVTWMTLGRLLYAPKVQTLLFRSDGCPDSRATPFDVHSNCTTNSNLDSNCFAYVSTTTNNAISDTSSANADVSTRAINFTVADNFSDDYESTGGRFGWLYGISYTWTGPLGCTLCVLVGLLVTLCECKCWPGYTPTVEPELLHPWCRTWLREGGVGFRHKKTLSTGPEREYLSVSSQEY